MSIRGFSIFLERPRKLIGAQVVERYMLLLLLKYIFLVARQGHWLPRKLSPLSSTTPPRFRAHPCPSVGSLSPVIYWRFSDCHWGPRKFPIFGERRNGGKPNSHASFILQAHFDEGAVAIHYGVPRIIRFYLDFCELASKELHYPPRAPREFLSRFAQTIGFAVRLPAGSPKNLLIFGVLCKLLDLLSWLLL